MKLVGPFTSSTLVVACWVSLSALDHARFPTPGAAQDSRERAMYVSVLDDKGVPVTDLTQDQFVVREDGVRREVLRIRRATDPIDIALLVDNTQAMTPFTNDLRLALASFVGQMSKNNPIALITFADRPTIITDYTKDLARLTRGVQRVFAQEGSGSYLLDAIVEVCRGIRLRKPERVAIVAVLTEGPELSNLNYPVVLDALRDSQAKFDALVVSIGQAADVLSDEGRSRAIVLDQGTALAGGRRVDLLSSMGLGDALKSLASELSNQYLVTYSRPESLIPPEKIEVSVTRPGLVARGTPVPVRRG
jgi:Ca-activated chloride channel homolog